ncbi:response regulator transcription factor [Termitidicoccus mucosus]|uniref:LuxR family transcriptional regulator n=2 Tax=Termitidicoccus mucosus TaxID=1184151 RepID=A0A178ICV8_9BACT|nr:hypothetical protein AW736_20150 [Opitutaceae bacterium TSB47]
MFVCDQPVVRELLANHFSKLGAYAVTAPAWNPNTIIDEVKQVCPALVAIDFNLRNNAALLLLLQIRQIVPGIRILVFSGTPSPELIKSALEAGAHGYLDSSSTLAEFQRALSSVLEGRAYFSAEVNAAILNIMQSRSLDSAGIMMPLSQRELTVLRLMANGLSSKEIAKKLGISPYTVVNHRTKIMRKTGIHRAAQLSLYAAQIGLIPTPNSTHPFQTMLA